MHEVVMLQVGQCGNQIGNEFWNKIAAQHLEATDDRKDRFFYNSDSDKLIPRAVLIDSEPRAISSTIANSNNVFIANEGIGAGNNWAHGHYIAKSCRDDVLDIVNRHVEACDAMESIYLVHSTAGGTGSGFGSFLSEELRDMYPKSILTGFSILPNNNESSEVVVQPYNTILTLNSIYKNLDNVILMDNNALSNQISVNGYGIANQPLLSSNITFDSLNSIASDIISSYSASIRFPGHMYCDNRSILNCTVPLGEFKFLIPSYVKNRHFSVGEIMNYLVKQKSMCCNYEPSAVYSYFSIFNILDIYKNNEFDNFKAISRSIQLIQPKLSFVDLPYYLSTIVKTNGRSAGPAANVGLNNSTASKNIFRKICTQFDQLRKRNAFLEIYKKFDLGQESFDEARAAIEALIERYDNAELQQITY